MPNIEKRFRNLYELFARANLAEDDRKAIGNALDLLEEQDIQFKQSLLDITGVYDNNSPLATIQHGFIIYVEAMQDSIEKEIRNKHQSKIKK